MKTIQKILSWINEKDSLFFLIFLVLVIFVFTPLRVHSHGYSIFMQVVFSFLLITGVRSLPKNKLLKICAWILLAFTLAGRWASEIIKNNNFLSLSETVLTLVFLLMMIIVVLYHVFCPGRINKSRIEFAISGYLLVGLFWANLYLLVEKLVPGSILFGGAAIDLGHSNGLVFFSFVTLTTVGYGDMTVALPIARSVAIAEALIGQLYPVILLGRLVSLPRDS